MNMGESYIVINLDDDQQEERTPEEESKNLDEFIDSVRKSKRKEESSTVNLRLKVFGGPSSGETFQFERSVGQGDKILIGRSESCDVHIRDKLLSKIQATISFDEERQGWVLEDGFEERPSTNGIWIYLNEDYEIHEGLKLKTNQTIFQCHLHH